MPPRPLAGLSRDRVLSTALDLVDNEGVEALSMRRLAQDLDVWICYQEGDGAVLTVGTGVFDLRAAANTRQLVSLSAALTGLAPGTYKVGLCGKSGDASNWNSNEFSYTTALVTQ